MVNDGDIVTMEWTYTYHTQRCHCDWPWVTLQNIKQHEAPSRDSCASCVAVITNIVTNMGS